MAPSWKGEPVSREPSPEERARESEEPPDPFLSPEEEEAVRKILRRMRIFRPRLYKVLRAWLEDLACRTEPSGYSHGAYRGWYAEQAQKLRLTENGVKKRLGAAQCWLAERIRAEIGRE
jgi:hypothetical protein